jgi:hypothetical protein
MPIRYRPDPGSTESRTVELLRFLPAGTALHGGDLDSRLGLGGHRGLHTQLRNSVDHGLLRSEKRGEGRSMRTYWMDARGVAVWADSSLT